MTYIKCYTGICKISGTVAHCETCEFTYNAIFGQGKQKLNSFFCGFTRMVL